LDKFSSVQKSQTMGDIAVREKLCLDPDWLRAYLDIDDMYLRLTKLLEEGCPEKSKNIANQYVREYILREQGIDQTTFTKNGC